MHPRDRLGHKFPEFLPKCHMGSDRIISHRLGDNHSKIAQAYEHDVSYPYTEMGPTLSIFYKSYRENIV